MRWLNKKKPEEWDNRTVTCFLLFPMTIGLEGRWLEKATWRETYIDGWWTAREWLATQPERDGRGNP